LAGHVARKGKMRNSYKILVESFKELGLKDLKVNGRIILKWV